jgi:predicted Zn-ribbon and HTH transcriptional regulator
MADAKEQIFGLRAKGYGAKRISKELGVSLNTVKSAIRRSVGESANAGSCRNCGKEIDNKGGHRKAFCCDRCRSEWWNKRRSSLAKAGGGKKTCAYCGREFSSYSHKGQKYCSHECYIKARYHGGVNGDGPR